MLKDATAQPLEPAMFVIGPRLDPRVQSCDSFLHRNQIPTNVWIRTIPVPLHAPEGNPPYPPPTLWCRSATAHS